MLGEGGFAVVYLGRDEHANRDVAIKVLKDPANDRETAQRFQREVEIVGALRSPHAMALIDHGTLPTGELFAVFEYLQGRDLSDVLAERQRLPRPIVIRVLQQLLDVLGEAHGKGLLHRDIKPDNIRVLQESVDAWNVKLLDWGIARGTQDSHPRVTATGITLGTPRYMSPEQLRGLPLTAASDIYSLGLVGIEMLVGYDALGNFSLADQFERLRTGHVMQIPLRDPHDVALAAALHRMTTVDPSERLSTAAATRKVLDQLTDDERVHTLVQPAVSSRGRQPPSAREPSAGPSWGLYAALIGTVAVLAGLVWAWTTSEPESTPRNNVAIAPRAVPQPTPVRAPEPEDASQTDVATAEPAGTAGCGIERKGGEQMLSRLVGLHEARTLVYLPSDYDPHYAHPVWFLLHEGGQSPEELLDEVDLAAFADDRRIILVAPNGASTFGDWANVGAQEAVPLDFTELDADLCIDPDKRLVMGHTRGGRPVQWLDPEPGELAALVTSSFRLRDDAQLPDVRNLAPLLFLTPVHDRLYVPDEGIDACSEGQRAHMSHTEHEQQLVRRYQCGSAKRIPHKTYPDGDCYTFEGCAELLVSCDIVGGRHWAGAAHHGGCGGNPGKFPYGQVIWDFLEEAIADAD